MYLNDHMMSAGDAQTELNLDHDWTDFSHENGVFAPAEYHYPVLRSNYFSSAPSGSDVMHQLEVPAADVIAVAPWEGIVKRYMIPGPGMYRFRGAFSLLRGFMRMGIMGYKDGVKVNSTYFSGKRDYFRTLTNISPTGTPGYTNTFWSRNTVARVLYYALSWQTQSPNRAAGTASFEDFEVLADLTDMPVGTFNQLALWIVMASDSTTGNPPVAPPWISFLDADIYVGPG